MNFKREKFSRVEMSSVFMAKNFLAKKEALRLPLAFRFKLLSTFAAAKRLSVLEFDANRR